MTELFYKVTKFIGVDKAIFYRCSGIMISAVSGILVLALITLFFTLDEQGVYYTFSSIAALQIFFELGLTGIIIQYVAHEVAHLKFKGNNLEGAPYYQSRLASLLHLFVKWYLITAFLLLFFLMITGWIFFRSYSKDTVLWRAPWIVLCIGTSLFLVVNMLLSFIEGFGYVKEMAKIRTFSSIGSFAAMTVCFISGHGLYALGVAGIVKTLISLEGLRRGKYQDLLFNVWRIRITDKLSYWKEIFPYQWKIALSWLSGYFIFHLFSPVLFAFDGAKAAGQMGLTCTVLMAITGLGLCWINTKIPMFSMLIAQKDYSALDQIFYRTLKQMILITCSLFSIFLLMLTFLSYFSISYNDVPLAERFLPMVPLLFMTLSSIANLWISSFAVYLRCHKEEPYMWLSLIFALVSGLAIILLTKYFNMDLMTFVYFIIAVISNIYAYIIFKRKKAEWHDEST